MKKNSTLEKLTDIDDELIIEAIEYQPLIKKNKAWTHIVKVAAGFLIVLVSGVIVVKAMDIPINFLGKISGKEESEYSISRRNESIPLDEFSEEVQGERKTILQQLENAKPWDNIMPTHLQRDFLSQKEAIAYIGYEGLKELELELPEKAVIVSLEGDSNGNISEICMEVFFQKDDINIQVFSIMYTEFADLSENITINVQDHYTTYEEETITLGTNQWLVVNSQNTENNTKNNKEAYTIKDKIEYNINIAYRQKDTKEAETLLKKCMELFS